MGVSIAVISSLSHCGLFQKNKKTGIIKRRSIIVIANDPANEGRYLLLLQKKGLKKLKDVVDILPTITTCKHY